MWIVTLLPYRLLLQVSKIFWKINTPLLFFLIWQFACLYQTLIYELVSDPLWKLYQKWFWRKVDSRERRKRNTQIVSKVVSGLLGNSGVCTLYGNTRMARRVVPILIGFPRAVPSGTAPPQGDKIKTLRTAEIGWGDLSSPASSDFLSDKYFTRYETSFLQPPKN